MFVLSRMFAHIPPYLTPHDSFQVMIPLSSFTCYAVIIVSINGLSEPGHFCTIHALFLGATRFSPFSITSLYLCLDSLPTQPIVYYRFVSSRAARLVSYIFCIIYLAALSPLLRNLQLSSRPASPIKPFQFCGRRFGLLGEPIVPRVRVSGVL